MAKNNEEGDLQEALRISMEDLKLQETIQASREQEALRRSEYDLKFQETKNVSRAEAESLAAAGHKHSAPRSADHSNELMAQATARSLADENFAVAGHGHQARAGQPHAQSKSDGEEILMALTRLMSLSIYNKDAIGGFLNGFRKSIEPNPKAAYTKDEVVNMLYDLADKSFHDVDEVSSFLGEVTADIMLS